MSERYTNDAELAEAFGVSTRTIERYRNDGKIPPKKNGKGTPFNRSVQQYIELLKNGDISELEEERIRLTRAQADDKELDVKQKRGELIPAEIVEIAWQGQKANMKAKLLNIPTKLAPLIVGETTIEVIKDKAQELIYEALEELANDGIPREYQQQIKEIISNIEATAKSDG